MRIIFGRYIIERRGNKKRAGIFRNISYYLGVGINIKRCRPSGEYAKNYLSNKNKSHKAGEPFAGLGVGIKMPVKKILFYFGDGLGETPRYYVYNIIEALSLYGVEFDVVRSEEELMSYEEGYDILICLRGIISDKNIDGFFSRLKKERIPILFFIDDYVWNKEKCKKYVDAIKNFSQQELELYLNGVSEYNKMMRMSDYILCSSSYLVKEASKINKSFLIPATFANKEYQLSKSIIPDSLNTKYYRGSKVCRIGYFGGHTHLKDFEQISSVLIDICKNNENIELHLFEGNHEIFTKADIRILGDRLVTHRYMPHIDMLKLLARMDINLAPLEDGNEFSMGKSALKVFEAALFQVPTVASDIPSYSECISDGIDGFIARSQKEWKDYIMKLVKKESFRRTMGKASYDNIAGKFYIHTQADYVLGILGSVMKDYELRNPRNIDIDNLDVAWFVQATDVGSGGHRNIYRAINQLSNRGYKITVYCINCNPQEQEASVSKHFFKMENVKFLLFDAKYIKNHDAFFCTTPHTVYNMMQYYFAAKYHFYFVQDNDSMFCLYGSSSYFYNENTYNMGLTHITSGVWPANLLKSRYKAEADSFSFPVNKGVYNTKIARSKKNRNIVFFARTEPRRCFELGIEMLRKLKIMAPDIEVILYGSSKININIVDFDHEYLGMLPSIDDIANIYRNADLGIVFSSTNPSLVPYEMMACGLAVAEIDFDDIESKFKSRNNILPINPIPNIAAEEIYQVMMDDNKRKKISQNGKRYVDSNFGDENQMGKRISDLIKKKITTGKI